MEFEYKGKKSQIRLYDVEYDGSLGVIEMDYFLKKVKAVIDKGGNIWIPFSDKYIDFDVIDWCNIIIYESDKKRVIDESFKYSLKQKENFYTHYKINLGVLERIELPAWIYTYKQVNKNILELIDESHEVRALYNIKEGRVCTPIFDSIKSYSDIETEGYFCTSIISPDYIDDVELFSYIDLEGNFTTPVYDNYHDSMYEIDSIQKYNDLKKQICIIRDGDCKNNKYYSKTYKRS